MSQKGQASLFHKEQEVIVSQSMLGPNPAPSPPQVTPPFAVPCCPPCAHYWSPLPHAPSGAVGPSE